MLRRDEKLKWLCVCVVELGRIIAFYCSHIVQWRVHSSLSVYGQNCHFTKFFFFHRRWNWFLQYGIVVDDAFDCRKLFVSSQEFFISSLSLWKIEIYWSKWSEKVKLLINFCYSLEIFWKKKKWHAVGLKGYSGIF